MGVSMADGTRLASGSECEVLLRHTSSTSATNGDVR